MFASIDDRKSLGVEFVAGTGAEGNLDGALNECSFNNPLDLCQYGDSLFITDCYNYAVKEVKGVLGVSNPMAECVGISDNTVITASEFETCAVLLIMEAILTMPKELAQLTAQYARPRGSVHKITGWSDKMDFGAPDFHGEVFHRPMYIAVDTTDPIAGAQLMISCGYGDRLRCLNLRTQMVTSIAGDALRRDHIDGPALQAAFGNTFRVVVAPNGVLFAADMYNDAVRRISAAKWLTPDKPPAERTVSTLIGARGANVHFAKSIAGSFQQPLQKPTTLALHAPLPSDTDVGQLYVGCANGIYAFDLVKGERRYLSADVTYYTGLAVTDDGTRLFAVNLTSVNMFDTHTGVRTTLIPIISGRIRAGPITNDRHTTGGFGRAYGAVIDKTTQSLIMCDSNAHQIIRLRDINL